MPLLPARPLLLTALLLIGLAPGCALYNASQDDPDEGGSDLIEADMVSEMGPDMSEPLDMEDMLDMNTPDLDLGVDMDMAAPVDMPPDMPPACADFIGSDMPQQATAVAVGEGFSCALLADKTVKCWGDNQEGQLGDGGRLLRHSPRRVTGLCEGAVAIGAGAHHACAVLESGKVACWGLDNLGQLGDGRAGGNDSSIRIPVATRAVEVLDITDAKRVYGGEYYTCALRGGDMVSCWGRNNRGQLGVGNTAQQLRPSRVSAADNTFSQLSAGENSACAVLNSGEVACWGRNEFGELGTPGPANASRPTGVLNLTEPSRVSSGKSLTCALARDADIGEMPGTNMLGALCWGALGKFNGMADSDGNLFTTSTPQPIHLTEDGQEIYVGESFACMLKKTGAVTCWGVNGSYQLGHSAGGGTTMFTNVELPGGVIIDTSDDTKMDIEATGSHACAVTSEGEVYCWGKNDKRQLGLNGAALSLPVKVMGL